MERVSFWLLDINYEVDKDSRKAEIWLWGIDEEGKRVLVIDRNFSAYFYLVIEQNREPQEILERVQKLSDDFPFISGIEIVSRRLFGQPVNAIKVYCQDPDVVSKYAIQLSKIDGVEKCLEDDIRYSMRYLIDNDIRPCSWLQVEAEEERLIKVQAEKVYIAKSTPKPMEREDIPHLRVLSFFPIYYCPKGTPKPQRDPVVVIAASTNTGERKQFTARDHNDAEILMDFINFIKNFDPDIIIGYESNRRHWQYLQNRADALGIKFIIDRAGGLPHLSVYGHISITGRIGMDTHDFFDEFPELKLKTLESMADFLGVKRMSEWTVIEEAEFSVYWDNPSRKRDLLQFSSEAAECLLGIFEKLFEYSLELSKLVGIPLDQIGKAAVGFRIEWYIIRESFKMGELIPARTERPYVPYAGGMVLAPKPGIHENIVVLDFKSMYPTIMIEKNISPDTYVPLTCHFDSSEVYVAPEVKHMFRKRPPGLYKRVLSGLISVRENVKRKLKDLSPESPEYRLLSAREKAVKVITNAAYGYAGWIGARWFIKPVAEATTAWGRETIATSIKIAEELGLNVIYSDTDSIFVMNDPEKVDRLCRIIRETTGLEIKPDKFYTRIFFTEAKKRYCGLLEDGSLDIVGLEVVRGDWANVAKDTQENVLRIILRERSERRAVEFVQEYINKLRQRKIPLSDLVIWKTLTKPLDEYEVNAPHVEAARLLEKEGWSLSVGDKIGYVIVQGSGKLYERAKPHILASLDEVDVEYYIANQVIPAALRILSMFGVREEDILPKHSTRKPKTLADFLG
ncbi:MAG: DNA polymerase domain-containing protein [Nitrososphaerota archaeon]|nr:DNA polymerase II [Candidatus Bathyarchaeota archaeon]MDW8048741.1 DNA polymerase domain-containing protein [Nitrososphaerota archaeon]